MTHTVTQDIASTSEMFAGEDKVIEFTVKDSADVVVNITGWVFEFEVRLTPYNANIVLAKTGLTPSDAPNGKVQVPLASNDTKNLKAGTYHYGLARTNSGAYDVVAEGEFVLRKAAVHA
jgi:hypothetical protein